MEIKQIRGVLEVSKGERSWLIMIDSSLKKSSSIKLTETSKKALVLDFKKLPLSFLRLPKITKHVLKILGIQTIGELPKEKEELKKLFISEKMREEILEKWRRIEYLRKSFQLENRELDKDFLVFPQDRLLKNLLSQPVSYLFQERSYLIRFAGLGVKTINDLVNKRKEDLDESWGKQGIGFNEKQIGEIKKRLLDYQLRLREGMSSKKLERFFALSPKLATLTPKFNREEIARRLGDNFSLLEAYRQASSEKERIYFRNQLVVKNQRLVHAPAMSALWFVKGVLKDQTVELEDLRQEGLIGMMQGIPRYDYLTGFRFSTYIFWWIKQNIYRSLTEYVEGIPSYLSPRLKKILMAKEKLAQELEKEPSLEEIAQELEMPLWRLESDLQGFWFLRHKISLQEEIKKEGAKGEKGGKIEEVVRDRAPDIEELMLAREKQEGVRAILSEAPLLEVDRQMLELYFKDDYTYEAIGELYGLTRERVHQRIERALEVLRTPEFWEKFRVYYPWLNKPQSPEKSQAWKQGIECFETISQKAQVNWGPGDYLKEVAEFYQATQGIILNPGSLYACNEYPIFLTVAHSILIALLYSQGQMRINEIAEFLGLSDISIDKNLTRVRKALKKYQKEVMV